MVRPDGAGRHARGGRQAPDQALAAAAQDPVVKQQLGDLGLEAVGDTPEEFGRAIRVDLDKWTQIVKQAGIKPD